MTSNPFTLFAPFQDRLRVCLFTKEDDAVSDQIAAEELHAEKSAGLQQVHGGDIVIVQSSIDRSEKGDGMITDQTDVALCMRSADCQLLVAYAPDRHVLGMAHAGWRGLLAGVIPHLLKAMQDQYQVDPAELRIAMGPSLCLKCSTFTSPAEELPGTAEKFFHGNNVDLRGIAEEQIFSCDVQVNHFERHTDCTRCSAGKFWTYRGGDREDVKLGKCNLLACRLLPQ